MKWFQHRLASGTRTCQAMGNTNVGGRETRGNRGPEESKGSARNPPFSPEPHEKRHKTANELREREKCAVAIPCVPNTHTFPTKHPQRSQQVRHPNQGPKAHSHIGNQQPTLCQPQPYSNLGRPRPKNKVADGSREHDCRPEASLRPGRPKADPSRPGTNCLPCPPTRSTSFARLAGVSENCCGCPSGSP